MAKDIPFQDRQVAVDALQALLKEELLTKQDLVVDVYNYIPSNPQGITPFLAVAPRGTDPRGITARRTAAQHEVAVYIYSLYDSDALAVDEAEAWTTLNALLHATAQVIMANSGQGNNWAKIEWAELSRITVLVLDNQGYLVEAIPLIITLV